MSSIIFSYSSSFWAEVIVEVADEGAEAGIGTEAGSMPEEAVATDTEVPSSPGLGTVAIADGMALPGAVEAPSAATAASVRNAASLFKCARPQLDRSSSSSFANESADDRSVK